MSDDDIKKKLKDAYPPAEYPPHLKTATKAEFTTLAKSMKPPEKKGCPLMLLQILGVIVFIGAGIWATITYIL